MKALIVGNPAPFIKGGYDFPKIGSLGEGGQKVLLQIRDNLEMGRIDIGMRGGCGDLPLFYYFTVQLHLLCVQV